MTIDAQLTDKLKDAMRSKDRPVLDAIRNVRTEITRAATEKGASGEITDELCTNVIAAYVKKLQKTVPQFEAAGERGAAQVDKLRFEIDYLSQWLPQTLDEAATRELVAEAIAATGAADAKDAGRVMGHVMKAHRDTVDPAVLKRLVDEALAAAS